MSAIGGKADMVKLPALKILSGWVAPVCDTKFGGWQGAGARFSRVLNGRVLSIGSVAANACKSLCRSVLHFD